MSLSTTALLCQLFFLCYGHHADLHSFPTRRSSDLRADSQTLLIRVDPSQLHPLPGRGTDRKSTRLNSSHTVISYAVFCLKKKRLNESLSYTVYSQFEQSGQ